MAARLIASAETWESVFTAFANINFSAFDYNTVKQSVLDYVKLYYPETFNDYIESSEFIALVEAFAYVCEQMAYRFDVNAQENFITSAQRRDSILRLAKLVSYTPSRIIPARGLVKITSISTTESVLTPDGTNLANQTIRWADPTVANWKENFLLVINRVLSQQFGSVTPSDRFQIENVLFEIYSLNMVSLATGVFPYSVSISGQTYPMELVSTHYDSTLGITERRPQLNSDFTLMYASDGFGDASNMTGFFMYTKQGSLQRFRTTFDGITPNQSYNVNVPNVNETDVWINNIDPTTNQPILSAYNIPYKTANTIYGNWVQVDVSHAQNVIFNTNPQRNKYEIQALSDGSVNLVFGDGEFADVPNGTFDVWVRASANEDLTVPQTSVVNKQSSFSYVDINGQTQTFAFSYTLVNALQNASAAEDIESVRTNAPAVYYSQDRMVNGQDYNTFMLQDPSIMKLRATNRTFAGDSNYIPWFDPSTSYANVKHFSDDGALYYQNQQISVTTDNLSATAPASQIIPTYLTPLLSSTDLFLLLVSNDVNVINIRKTFNSAEISRINTALTTPPSPISAGLYYHKTLFAWYAVKTGTFPPGYTQISQVYSYTGNVFTLSGVNIAEQFIPTDTLYANNTPFTIVSASNVGPNTTITVTTIPLGFPSGALLEYGGNYISSPLVSNDPIIKITQSVVGGTTYTVSWIAERLIVQSPTTRFWNTNNGSTVLDYDTLNADLDEVVILESNPDNTRKQSLTQNYNFNVLAIQTIDSGTELGLPDYSRISVLPEDTTGTGIPDTSVISKLFNPTLTVNTTTFSKTIVRVATTANITLSGLQTIDGISLTNGDLVLVKNQSLPATNGIYTVRSGSWSLNVTAFGDSVLSVTGATYAMRQFSYNPTLSGTTSVSTGFWVSGLYVQLPIYYITTSTTDIAVVGNGSTSIIWSPVVVATTNPTITNYIWIQDFNGNVSADITIKEYVYFSRLSQADQFIVVETSFQTIASYMQDQTDNSKLYRRNNGRSGYNFAWFHFTTNYYLVDPAPSNIIDIFIITKGYYLSLKQALQQATSLPAVPTPLDLRTSYQYLVDNKMISDTVVLQPGSIQLLFGPNAPLSLQATFSVIKSSVSILTDNQIKATIVTTIQNFFDISQWEFGETFYFSELAAAIHQALPVDISSVVLVPVSSTSVFGNLFQVSASQDQIFYPDVSVNQITLVTSYTPTNLRIS